MLAKADKVNNSYNNYFVIVIDQKIVFGRETECPKSGRIVIYINESIWLATSKIVKFRQSIKHCKSK